MKGIKLPELTNIMLICFQTVSSTGNVIFSEVKTFLMRQTSVISMYKSLTTSRNDTIILSDTHLLYAIKSSDEKFHPM